MDIMWLRDPFPRLFSEGDFKVSCDRYNGNSTDKRNSVNTGFKFVQANHRTVEFYKYWYAFRWRFRGKKDQDVLNKIKTILISQKNSGLQWGFSTQFTSEDSAKWAMRWTKYALCMPIVVPVYKRRFLIWDKCLRIGGITYLQPGQLMAGKWHGDHRIIAGEEWKSPIKQGFRDARKYYIYD